MLTQNALAQVMGIDPATGIALQQQQLKTKDAQVGVASDQQSYLASNVLTPAMEAYQNALKTMPQTAAMQVAQQVYSASLSAAKSSGVFSSDQSDQMPQNFDPNRIGGALESYSDYQKQQEQQSALQQKSDYDDQLLAIDNAKIGITAANDGLNAPGGATLNASPGTSGANLNPPVTQQDQDDINSLLGPIPASAGGASAGTAQPPQTAPSIKPVPGYSLPATQAMVQQYLTTGKEPNFGGGGIGRRQKEAFYDAVGAAQVNGNGQLDPALAGYSKPAMDLMAETYKDTGVIPSFGSGKDAANARRAFMNYVASKGITASQLASNHADYKADSSSLSNLQKLDDSAAAYEKTANANVGLVVDNLQKGVASNWGPAFNRWIQSGRVATGDPNVTAFDTAIISFADEYAKVMSGSTGSTGSTDASRAQANEMLNPNLGHDQILANIAIMQQDMANKRAKYQDQINTIKSRLGSQSPPSSQPTPASGQTPAPPAVGTVMQGYRFNGGDPSDPASWSKV
jgi:hypothetical protein